MDKRVVGLDGWRGISVSLVVIGHLITYRYSELFSTGDVSFRDMLARGVEGYLLAGFEVLNRMAKTLAHTGVQIFFCISGFIITHLLIQEERKHGTISLKGFYWRRCMRILPVFLVYILFVAAMRAYGGFRADGESLMHSALFMCNFATPMCEWEVGHTWSLAIEEQFYLVWPFLFILGPKLRTWTAGGVLLAGMILYSTQSGRLVNNIHNFSFLAAGVLVATIPAFREWIARVGSWFYVAIAGYVVMAPLAASELTFMKGYIGALMPVLTCLLIFKPVFCDGAVRRLLCVRPLEYLGLLSYSIYIWQQLFTGPAGTYNPSSIFAYPVLMVIPILLSYYLIEKPYVSFGKSKVFQASPMLAAKSA